MGDQTGQLQRFSCLNPFGEAAAKTISLGNLAERHLADRREAKRPNGGTAATRDSLWWYNGPATERC